MCVRVLIYEDFFKILVRFWDIHGSLRVEAPFSDLNTNSSTEFEDEANEWMVKKQNGEKRKNKQTEYNIKVQKWLFLHISPYIQCFCGCKYVVQN